MVWFDYIQEIIMIEHLLNANGKFPLSISGKIDWIWTFSRYTEQSINKSIQYIMSSVAKFAKIVETTEVLSSSFKRTSEAANVCLSLWNIAYIFVTMKHTHALTYQLSQQSLFRIKFIVLHPKYKKVEKFFVKFASRSSFYWVCLRLFCCMCWFG